MAKRSYGKWPILKTINSHVGKSRFFGEMYGQGGSIGFIPRQEVIPSPFSYSPTHWVYLWKGHRVFIVETAHRRYDVFELPEDMKLATSEEELFPKEGSA